MKHEEKQCEENMEKKKLMSEKSLVKCLQKKMFERNSTHKETENVQKIKKNHKTKKKHGNGY